MSLSTAFPKRLGLRGRGRANFLVHMKRLALVALALTSGLVLLLSLRAGRSYDGYNYASWWQKRVNRGGKANFPTCGQKADASWNVTDLSGTRLLLSSYWREKPLVLEFGSLSCPIYQDNGHSMEDLFSEFQTRANIALLYTREAHPGWIRSSLTSDAEKLARARQLPHKGIHRLILVDDIAGTIHRSLGAYPNSVVVIGTDGAIAHFAVWNQPVRTREVLKKLLDGKRPACQADLETQPVHLGWFGNLRMLTAINWVGGTDAFFDFLSYLISG